MSPFAPFLDAEDLTACVDAEDSPAGLNARALHQGGCYFPLWLEPGQGFGDLFLSARATPRSFRYGLLGDNVLGLQWRLPNGTQLRLGGRTVKNVTGFDFIRFFNASQGRFGAPTRLVLRLRPRAEEGLELRLQGPWKGLKALARTVRASSWAHAIDSCDLHAEAVGAAIHLGFRAKASLLPLFHAQARAWAQSQGLTLSELDKEAPLQAHPWARAQAPLDDCMDLAHDWLERYGGGVHALLGQGILHLQNPVSTQGAAQGLHDLHQRLAEVGGHCEHPTLADASPSPQAGWQTELLRRLETVA